MDILQSHCEYNGLFHSCTLLTVSNSFDFNEDNGGISFRDRHDGWGQYNVVKDFTKWGVESFGKTGETLFCLKGSTLMC